MTIILLLISFIMIIINSFGFALMFWHSAKYGHIKKRDKVDYSLAAILTIIWPFGFIVLLDYFWKVLWGEL